MLAQRGMDCLHLTWDRPRSFPRPPIGTSNDGCRKKELNKKKQHGESIYELRAAQLGFYWLDSRGSSPGSTLMLTLMSSFLLLPWFDLIYSGGAREEIATTNPIQASFEASSAYYQVVRKSMRIHLKTLWRHTDIHCTTSKPKSTPSL